MCDDSIIISKDLRGPRMKPTPWYADRLAITAVRSFNVVAAEEYDLIIVEFARISSE